MRPCNLCPTCTCNISQSSSPNPVMSPSCPVTWRGGLSLCESQQRALYSGAIQCASGYRTSIQVRALDVAWLRNETSVAPSFSLIVFDSRTQLELYNNCRTYRPLDVQPMTACVDDTITYTAQGRKISFVLECLNDFCSGVYDIQKVCTFRGTGAFSVGLVGLVLCTLILILLVVVVLGMRFLWKARMETEHWVVLGGILFTSLCCVAFWASFLYIANTQQGVSNQDLVLQITFWMDRVVILSSSLTLLFLVYTWAVVVHRSGNVRRVKIIAIVMAVAIAVVGLGLSIYCGALVGPSFAQQIIISASVFYGLFYPLNIFLSVVLLFYGIRLLLDYRKAHEGLETAETSRVPLVRLVILLVVIVACNVGRFITATIMFARTLSADPETWYRFAGLTYIIWFESFTNAILFYVFVFVIADTIPSMVILVLMLLTAQKPEYDRNAGKKRTTQNMTGEQMQPLLDRPSSSSSGINRYEDI